MKYSSSIIAFILACLLSGCMQTYQTPGTRANLAELAPMNIKDGFLSEPSNPFPANIVAIRVQDGNYTNYNLGKYGGVVARGRYSVVPTREVEEEKALEQIQSLPKVNQIISLNRLLLPDQLNSLDQLRESASKLKGDLILLYTFDTVFFDEDKARVLTTITLGFSPNKRIHATTTASALLIDTRTGYIYSAYESTASDKKLSSAWGTRELADKVRLETEKEAFSKLADEFVKTWGNISNLKP